jgi:hypothetical protein
VNLEQETKLAEEMADFTVKQSQQAPHRWKLASSLLQAVLSLLVIGFVSDKGTDGGDRRIIWEQV